MVRDNEIRTGKFFNLKVLTQFWLKSLTEKFNLDFQSCGNRTILGKNVCNSQKDLQTVQIHRKQIQVSFLNTQDLK